MPLNEKQINFYRDEYRVQNEDTEDLLRRFLHHELEINYRIEFGNVLRFKTRSGDNRRPPIVARFVYHSDLRFVLNNANKLRQTIWN